MPRVFKAGYALAGYQESSEDEESATPAAGHEAPPPPPPCTRCPAASAQALLVFAIVAVVSSAVAVMVIFQIARHQPLIDRVAASLGKRAQAFFGELCNSELPRLGRRLLGLADAQRGWVLRATTSSPDGP